MRQDPHRHHAPAVEPGRGPDVVQGLAAVCQDFIEGLNDANLESTQEIAACGLAAKSLLLEVAERLVGTLGSPRRPTRQHEIWIEAALLSLWSLANENVNAVPFHTVTKRWLRLYTDAALLHGMWLGWQSRLQSDIPGKRTMWLTAIKRLDMALIVAGGVGTRRMEWIHQVIDLLQCVQPDLELERPIRKGQAEVVGTPQPRLSIAPSGIEERSVEQAGGVRIGTTPYIVRSYFNSEASDVPIWPAIEQWRSGDYLLSAVGEGRCVPVEVGRSYTDDDWGQEIVSFREFLGRAGFNVAWEGGEPDDRKRPPLYLAQHTLLQQMPQLGRDIAMPDLVWSEPPASAFPSYRPPNTLDNLLINVWVGSGDGVVTPAHTDPYMNCYAQVTGFKRVWLAPPACALGMYAYGQANVSKLANSADLPHEYMHNTSSVPIFALADQPELRTQYPQFFDMVWPSAQEALLGPGDMLFMPPGWWHAMRGEGSIPGWSVSIWF